MTTVAPAGLRYDITALRTKAVVRTAVTSFAYLSSSLRLVRKRAVCGYSESACSSSNRARPILRRIEDGPEGLCLVAPSPWPGGRRSLFVGQPDVVDRANLAAHDQGLSFVVPPTPAADGDEERAGMLPGGNRSTGQTIVRPPAGFRRVTLERRTQGGSSGARFHASDRVFGTADHVRRANSHRPSSSVQSNSEAAQRVVRVLARHDRSDSRHPLARAARAAAASLAPQP